MSTILLLSLEDVHLVERRDTEAGSDDTLLFQVAGWVATTLRNLFRRCKAK